MDKLELENILIKLQNAGIDLGLLGAPDDVDPSYSIKEALKALKQAMDNRVVKELEWALNMTDELSVTDLEKWEYQNDGLPLLAINPDLIEKRVRELKNERG